MTSTGFADVGLGVFNLSVCLQGMTVAIVNFCSIRSSDLNSFPKHPWRAEVSDHETPLESPQKSNLWKQISLLNPIQVLLDLILPNRSIILPVTVFDPRILGSLKILDEGISLSILEAFFIFSPDLVSCSISARDYLLARFLLSKLHFPVCERLVECRLRWFWFTCVEFLLTRCVIS